MEKWSPAELKGDYHIEIHHPEIIAIAQQVKGCNEIESCKNAFYFVRDNWIYDPFNLDIRSEGLRASNLLDKKRAWCVEKAIFLCTLCRILEIPSRLGFGIVKNHIGTANLLQDLRREEIVFHGFTEVLLAGKWVKLTPAFDRRICAISKVEPLDFSATEDVLFQEFSNGQHFMEYIYYYGSFSAVPVHLMNSEMKQYYPHLFTPNTALNKLEFRHEGVVG